MLSPIRVLLCHSIDRIMKKPPNIILYLLGFFALVVATVIYLTRPVTNVQSAVPAANRLIANAGGPAKVRGEAGALLSRFGTSDPRFLTSAEIKDYPAVASLGDIFSIWPGAPPYVEIRVGSHLNGFFIDIVSTNGPGHYRKLDQSAEIASGIFLRR